MPEQIIPIHLPRLFDKQLEIANHPAKRKVINAGRRGGKTTLAACIAIEGLLAGKVVMYVAPKSKQTDAFWQKCQKYVREAIQAGVIERNKSNRTLKLNDGVVSCQTGFNADTIRSSDADILFIDENAYMAPDAWDMALAPMLIDRDGDAFFIGTPNRRNHHFAMFQRGLEDGAYWHSWKYSSFDNPHLSKKALAELAENMTEDAIQQEIYAEFLEGQGAVFRNIPACLNAPYTTPEAHAGHSKVAGIDWGKQNDFTVISVGCTDCHMEVDLDRFNQIDWALQYGRLSSMFRKWGIIMGVVEHNSIGDPGFEALVGLGHPVTAFDTTAISKPPLIDNMALAFERAEWQFLPDAIAKGELEAYERKVSEQTGRSSYSAPEGMHDDTVMARALMLNAANVQYVPSGEVNYAEPAGFSGSPY